MIFCYIQEHVDAYPLFYDRFWCLFKRIVFQNYFWRREKDCRPGRLLFFAAVSLMAWLASGFPSGLFPAVRDLFLPECFGRRDRGIFIITVYLCTEFQIFSLFFFQPDCCFIKLLEPVITDTYRFLMGIRRFFLLFQDPGSISPAFLLMKLFQPDYLSPDSSSLFLVCATFRRHRSVIRS